MEYLFLFLLGIALGSFLNVVIFRYKPGQFSWSILRGRSHCDACGRQLRWYELIPLVSFIIQKGACRSCHKKLSWQHPVIEGVVGIVAVGLWSVFIHGYVYFFGVDPMVRYGAWLLWMFMSMLLVYAFMIDLRHRVIPNGTNLLLAVGGVVWTVLVSVLHNVHRIGMGSFLGSYGQLWQWNAIWVNHLAGMIIAGLFFGLIVLFSRGRGMGMGDVKLIAALGLLFGWPDIALVVVASFIIGTIVLFPLLLLRKKKRNDAVPFGPFIVLASFLVLFWGAGLLQVYFDIIQKLGSALI